MPKEKIKAVIWAVLVTGILARLIALGSINFEHLDAALIGYTFATLFATFGITYRYALWLQRPPTAVYWRRGWTVFFRMLRPKYGIRNVVHFLQRIFVDFALTRFIWRRGKMRWAAHWLTMWGCIIAFAITFPLVFGWVHFRTVPDDLRWQWYQVHVFGVPTIVFPIDSVLGFLTFHALVWASFLVIAGVLIALQRRFRDHGAAALQQFGEDVLPLLLLFAISVTGLMMTASYSWMKGYAYDFLAILHAVTVIFTLLWLPFGKFFHIFQRSAQIGVGFYKEVGAQGEQAKCRRCGDAFASRMHVEDLISVEKQLGYQYEIADPKIEHYQWICPRCRRSLFALSQGLLWQGSSAAQAGEAPVEPLGRSLEMTPPLIC